MGRNDGAVRDESIAAMPTSNWGTKCMSEIRRAMPWRRNRKFAMTYAQLSATTPAERHKATPRVSYAFANVSAARMARSIMVNVGLALPEEGKTEALATLKLGMR